MRALFLIIIISIVGFSACESEEVKPVDDQVEDVVGKQGDQNDDQQQTNDDQEENNNQNTNQDNQEQEQEEEQQAATCENQDKVYYEKNGLVTIDFEQVPRKNGWKKASSTSGYLGGGYIYWDGPDYFSQPGNGKIVLKIKITNPGKYRILWRNRILKGDNGTEHNDSWLRMPDADNFFGENGDSRVFPVGSGKTPNPKGQSKDGWFKIYMSGTGKWKWQARTSDHDPHQIYAVFNKAGIYTMEISARSSYHALDRVALFKDNISEDNATKDSNGRSTFDCK